MLQNILSELKQIQQSNAERIARASSKMLDIETNTLKFVKDTVTKEVTQQIKDEIQGTKKVIEEVQRKDQLSHKKYVEHVDNQMDWKAKLYNIKNKIPNSAQETLKEKYSQEKRKVNIIMFNVPEASAVNTKTPADKMKDKLFIQKVFSEILGKDMQTVHVKYLVRLGKFSSKCRPLLVSFFNEDMKLKVIRNAKKLAESIAFSEIKIVRDKTPKERAVYRILKDEIRARGEPGLVICGGKIVRSMKDRIKRQNGTQGGLSYLGSNMKVI